MISVLAGMYAFMFKVKVACWASLLLFFASAVNTKADNRLQHVITGFSIIVISFVTCYYQPPRLGPHHLPEDLLQSSTQ